MELEGQPESLNAEKGEEVVRVEPGSAVDEVLERTIVRRTDMWLLPFTSLMYFFNAIDRVSSDATSSHGMLCWPSPTDV